MTGLVPKRKLSAPNKSLNDDEIRKGKFMKFLRPVAQSTTETSAAQPGNILETKSLDKVNSGEKEKSVIEILIGEYFENLLKYVLQSKKGFDTVKVHLQTGIDLYVTKTFVAQYVTKTFVAQCVTEILFGEYLETLLKYVLELKRGFDHHVQKHNGLLWLLTIMTTTSMNS